MCNKHDQTRGKREQQKHGSDIPETALPADPVPVPTKEKLHSRRNQKQTEKPETATASCRKKQKEGIEATIYTAA